MKNTDTTTKDSEPRNVAAIVTADRVTLGPTDYGRGPLPVGLTATEAKALADLGLITITGIFTEPA